MRDKVAVDKKDYFRILHTEVLPYEVPILFSNASFYSYAKAERAANEPCLIKSLFWDGRPYTVAFDYEVIQGKDKVRTLSIIHPYQQIFFVDFYKKFPEVILSLCRKSDFSLRFPFGLAAFFYEKDYAREDDELKTESVEEEPEAFGDQSTHASSFFAYARYAQLYRFIDSQEFINLELEFPFLLKFDIKRCFNSIYTHSFSWAVKGKIFSKENVGGYAFDSLFDNLMQKSNFNETNGIVIGPEVSRIFAEIILQQIDVDIKETLRGLRIDERSYAIRRYVDDYFIFATSWELADRIFGVAQDSLKQYKLYVNDAKTDRLTAPFVTPQTAAKRDVQEVLGQTLLPWLNYLKKLFKEESASIDTSHVFQLKTPYRLVAKIMRDVKIAAHRSGVSFDVFTSYALGSITKSLYRLQKAANGKPPLQKDQQVIYQNVVIVCVELAFFFCSMDFRVRTTYLVSQIMIVLMRLTEDDLLFQDHLKSLITNQVDRLCSIYNRRKAGVEIYNLLIALKSINSRSFPGQRQLLGLINKNFNDIGVIRKEEFVDFNYFDYVAMLFLAGDHAEYSELREAIELSLLDRFEDAKDFRKDAELTLLFTDLLCCPYLSKHVKKSIVSMAFKHIQRRACNEAEVNHVINYVTEKIRFFDWGADVRLEKLLFKKRLNPAY